MTWIKQRLIRQGQYINIMCVLGYPVHNWLALVLIVSSPQCPKMRVEEGFQPVSNQSSGFLSVFS
jgi:hypothetical protein